MRNNLLKKETKSLISWRYKDFAGCTVGHTRTAEMQLPALNAPNPFSIF